MALSFLINIPITLCCFYLIWYLRPWTKFLFLSSLFEKLRDARDKTLVCKNRKPNKLHDIHRIINKEAVRIVTKIQYVQCLGYFWLIFSRRPAVLSLYCISTAVLVINLNPKLQFKNTNNVTVSLIPFNNCRCSRREVLSMWDDTS